jgi:hypothetical protein
MWNIDSLDWADPVPSSIADRVLRSVDKEGRGIILFHDIHERTVKALAGDPGPAGGRGLPVRGLGRQRLQRGQGRRCGDAAAPAPVAANGLRDSWAIVIGIDDYANWPKLQYAVRDARAIAGAGAEIRLRADRVITLEEPRGHARRHPGRVPRQAGAQRHAKERPLFVFFAGHGATRQLSSGRDLGYIVPADSDPNKLATDAIPMTEIQNIAESLTAKHVLFVMDACYSGLGLTRGGANSGLPARQRQAPGPPDADGRRRRPAGVRRRPERPLGVHLDAAAGPGRQGRPERRRPDHRDRAGGLCGAGGGQRVAADAGLRQPAGLGRRRLRVRAAGGGRVPEARRRPSCRTTRSR